MTQTVGGMLAELLGRLGAVTDRTPVVRAEVPPRRLGLGTTLDLLQVWLAALVPHAPELAPAQDLVAAERAEPAPDAPAASVAELDSLVGRADAALSMLLDAGPAIVKLTDLADTKHYLPPFAARAHVEVVRIRGLYCDALLSELRSPRRGPARQRLDEAKKAMDRFPAFLRTLYVADHSGIEYQIEQATQAWADLRALLAALGHDANYQVDAQGNWRMRAGLDAALGTARQMNETNMPGLEAAVRSLCQNLQALTVTLAGRTLTEQLTAWADEVLLHGDLVARVRGYVTEVDAILTTLDTADRDRAAGKLAEAAAGQVDAVTRFTALVARPALTADVTDLGDALGLQTTIKMTLLATAVVAGAALTAGAAGAAVAGLAGEATVAGIGVAAVGGFAVETLWFTIMVRAGNELLLGPESIAHSSFAEDLLWNAAMMGSLKAVERGFTTIFAQIAKSDTAAVRVGFVAGRFVSAQVWLFAFAELQSLLTRQRFMSGEEGSRAFVQQVAMGVMLLVGGFMRTSLTQRLSGVAPDLDAVRLELLEARREQLQVTFERIVEGTASSEEQAGYLRDVQGLWNDTIALLETLPPGDPMAETTLAQFIQAKADIELHLAHLGVRSALSLPGTESFFEPVRPGVVGFTEEALPALRKFYADLPGATLGDSAVAGLLEGVLPDGRRIFYLPLGDVPSLTPGPAALALARNSALIDALPDDIAIDGLNRLTAAGAGGLGARSVDSVLAAAGEHQIELLHLLAHPDLAGNTIAGLGESALSSIARDPQSMEVARAHGPLLVFRLTRAFTGGSTAFQQARDRAAELLEKTPEADRPALVASLIAGTRAQIATILGTAKPKVEPPPTATKEDLGINRGRREWRVLRIEIARKYPSLPPAEIDGRADIAQVLAAARAHRFKVTDHGAKLDMLTRFDKLCADSGLSTGSGSAWRGSLAEWLFLPRRGFAKVAWLRRAPSRVGVQGITVPDDWYQIDGAWEALELKSDLIDAPTADLPGLTALARRYLADARGDAENLPLGARYALWFIRDPGPAGRAAMMAELSVAGSPVTRVRFGSGQWQTVSAP